MPCNKCHCRSGSESQCSEVSDTESRNAIDLWCGHGHHAAQRDDGNQNPTQDRHRAQGVDCDCRSAEDGASSELPRNVALVLITKYVSILGSEAATVSANTFSSLHDRIR